MWGIPKKILFLCLIVCSLFAGAAQAAGANGIWTMSTGDYLVLMQDVTTGGTIGLQVSADLKTGKAWVGSSSGSSMQMSTLDGAGSLSAVVGTASLTGTVTQNGATQSFSATLAFAYAGSAYDGVWQKAEQTNAYLAYVTVSSAGARLGVVLDIKVNTDYTATYDVIVGSATNGVFKGAAMVSGNNLTLTFNTSVNPATTGGTYATNAFPPQTVSTFTATQIFKVGS